MRSHHNWRQKGKRQVIAELRDRIVLPEIPRCSGENPELGRIQINDFGVLSLEFCSVTSLPKGTAGTGGRKETATPAPPWAAGGGGGEEGSAEGTRRSGSAERAHAGREVSRLLAAQHGKEPPPAVGRTRTAAPRTPAVPQR